MLRIREFQETLANLITFIENHSECLQAHFVMKQFGFHESFHRRKRKPVLPGCLQAVAALP